MKPSIIHSIVVCLAAFTLPFMVACSSREESLPEVENSFLAVFTLDLGDTAYGTTRATPTNGEYAPGSGLENFIDFSKKTSAVTFSGRTTHSSTHWMLSASNVLEKKYIRSVYG